MKRKKLFILLALSLMYVQVMMAQTKIGGVVLDEMSEPLMGASVVVKGSSTGVITDLSGEFSLAVNRGATLVVSYVGFKTREVKIPQTGRMKVVLESERITSDEVVVVGVSMKKSDLTGAVSHVDSKTLMEKPVTNINEALQGRIAGLSVVKGTSPSDDASIKVRGTNTINAGSSPIYVVDGLVMGNDFGFYNSINVNDVESIEVLKDASATALYGSRGANGVIVVTTKKGRKGEGEISYDGWIGFSAMGHRPETMSAQQLFELRTEAYANGYMYNNPTANRQDYIDNTLMKTNIAFHDQEFEGYRSGKSYDWLKQVTQTGVQHSHNVSFSKATDNASVYLSLNANNLDGVVKGTEQTKYSGRVNAEAKIKPWLKVGTNTTYSYTRDEMPSSSVYNHALYKSNPLINYEPYMNDATRHNEEYLTLFWRVHSEENNNDFNPFNSMEIQTDRNRYHLTSSNYININPIKGLNIRSTFAVNRAEQSWNQFVPTGIQESIRNYSGDNYATQQRFGDTQWQWDNTVSYDFTLKDLHRFNAFVGTSASRNIYNVVKAGGRRFPSNDLSYNVLGAAADIENKEISSDLQNSSLMSYVGRVNYNYDYRYYVTLTGRYDGSSKFGEGHKWGFLPSFSLAWDVTNEKFFPQQNYVSRVKVRAGYGMVGNQDISNYQYVTLYYPQASNGTASYGTDGRRGTPGITWEKQKQANFGLDLGFFRNRLNVAMDLFFITNSNLLMTHNLPNTSGYTYTVENIGELKNKGFEITVNAMPVQTKDFTWNISANMSLDRNEVTKLYGGVDKILSGGRTGNIFIGESLSTIYTLKCGGIANENNRDQWEGIDYNGHTIGLGDLFPLDISGPDGTPDGVVDSYDRYIYGNTDPKVYGGFSTDFSWKGLTLNAIFNYSLGGHRISDYYESLISSVGQSYASIDLLDRWTEDNTNGYFPRRMTNVSGYSAYGAGDTDRYIQSTSYLRLANLTLAYNLTPNLLKKIHLHSLRVYFTASNLFTATSYKGFDPEIGDYNYPPARTYTFGLNFSF